MKLHKSCYCTKKYCINIKIIILIESRDVCDAIKVHRYAVNRHLYIGKMHFDSCKNFVKHGRAIAL